MVLQMHGGIGFREPHSPTGFSRVSAKSSSESEVFTPALRSLSMTVVSLCCSNFFGDMEASTCFFFYRKTAGSKDAQLFSQGV